jgi:hypothetical protein
MTRLKSWSGNETTAYSLNVSALGGLADFCRDHREVRIYGAGKIGRALGHYLEQSEIPYAGFVTSADVGGFKNAYKKSRTGVIVGVSDRYLAEIMPLLADFVADEDIFVLPTEYRERLGNQLSADYVRDNFWVNIFVTNRCNLACKSCSTFAPITPLCKTDTDYDPDEFAFDMRRLKKLNLPQLKCLKFTGGEPFLHRGLFDMFAAARALFPQTPFECYTNGLIANGPDEGKLAAIKELGVTLTVTEYPGNELFLREFYRKADKADLEYNVIFSEGRKFFSKRPLDLEKKTPAYCFADCPRYDMCTSLFIYRGKLWKCIYAFNSPLFNEAFSTNLELLAGDCLDMSSCAVSDIYKYATGRIPFCGYCRPITEMIPWALSERKIEEWT